MTVLLGIGGALIGGTIASEIGEGNIFELNFIGTVVGMGNALLVAERHSWRDRLLSLPRLAPFLILILIVMVALYGGWATPSEVAGIGAFGALVMVMLIYGCWRWADLKVILSGTARESSTGSKRNTDSPSGIGTSSSV